MEEETQQPQQEQATLSPIFETQKYSYKSKRLPGKPPVLQTGENLSAPISSGVNFQFGTIIS